jgi:hypothetical protein
VKEKSTKKEEKSLAVNVNPLIFAARFKNRENEEK